MNKDWLKQKVNTVTHKYAQYRVVSWFESAIVFNRQQLDSHINTAQRYKHDKTTTVVKLGLAQSDLVLKRYNPRSLGHKLKRALRQSRAERCWQMSYVFAEAGLNVATPVFMFEERFFFIRKHAYFANQYLAGDELLQVLPKMAEAEQLKVAQAFKSAMTIMQQHNISHGDMKASNILWVDEQLFFIDLDAARQHASSVNWTRANRRDRKRFLKNWQDQPELLKLFSWLE